MTSDKILLPSLPGKTPEVKGRIIKREEVEFMAEVAAKTFVIIFLGVYLGLLALLLGWNIRRWLRRSNKHDSSRRLQGPHPPRNLT